MKNLAKIFSNRTLYLDDVNGDIELASQRLQNVQAMENPLDIFQTSVGGKGPSGTGEEKSSRAVDFRGEKTSERFVNHDEMPKEQGEVKELRNLRTDSFDDYNLGQGFQNGDQLFDGDNRSQFSQGGASKEHYGKRELSGGKTARFTSSTFVDINQARHSTCDDSPRGPLVEDYPNKRGQQICEKPRDSGSRGRGRRQMRRGQSLSYFTENEDTPCQDGAIEQPLFQRNQLFVSGLSALTTEDCLMNFIEAMSGGEVEDVILRDDKALITMANDITGKSS